MIQVRPYEDAAAFQVFLDLDINDAIEVALWRGSAAAPLALFAEWRAIAPGSLVAFQERQLGAWVPFAIMALTPTGAAGVGNVALLARDHRRWRRPLAELARHWRRTLPAYCLDRGIVRAEARSWSGHPTAARLLRHVGLRLEARLPGFTGGAIFDQYAWTAEPNPEPEI